MNQIVSDFNQSQKDITVKATTLAWGTPYYTMLTTSTIARQAPDVAIMHLSRMASFAPTGIITPIDTGLMGKYVLTASDFSARPWSMAQAPGPRAGPIIRRVVQQRSAARGGKTPGAAERILRAALREFAKHGYAGARVERIYKRADVSPRSIYYHFGSKRGLYEAVRERLREQHFQDFAKGADTDPLLDRLLANVDLATTPRWQQWSRMLMWEALDEDDGIPPYPEGTEPGDLQVFRAAQERGEIDGDLDPHLLTLAFVAITFWPVMFPRSAQRLADGLAPDQLLEERKKLIKELVRRLGSPRPVAASGPGA
jgi:AcrR family transcriptional regulator